MKFFKLILVLGGLFALVLFGVNQARKVGFREGYAPVQPIAYSHKTHVGDNKLECLYCHYGADKSRHAGIPPVGLCMNCHKKVKTDSAEIKKLKDHIDTGKDVEWVRVHNLPDFAYFNHSQHVNVGNVSCQSCHGDVGNMDILKHEKPMNMGWCIECHRSNEISPPNDHKSMSGGDCAKCHY